MTDGFTYAFLEEAGVEVEALIGTIPTRWGRMSPLSRAVVVEAGRMLSANGSLRRDERFSQLGKTVGLIGATRTGSLATDRAFVDTLAAGFLMASPALFGYTLPNIPLAEAANQYGLTGPVYALFPDHAPLAAAVKEAQRWFAVRPDLFAMLVCAFDCGGEHGQAADLTVSFDMVSRNDG